MATITSKGKGKAKSTEVEPLLPSTTSTSTTPILTHGRGPLLEDSDEEDSQLNGNTRRNRGTSFLSIQSNRGSSSRRSLFLPICGSIFFILFFILAVTHIWLGHVLKEQSKNGSIEEMGSRGLLFDGPSRIAIRSGDDEGDGEDIGLIIKVEGRIGINAKKALGWEGKELGNWFKRTENRLASYVVTKLDTMAVEFNSLTLSSSEDGEEEEGEDLILISDMKKMLIPIDYPTSNISSTRMDNFILSIPLAFPSPAALGNFAFQVWNKKQYSININLNNLLVKPSKGKGFMRGLMRKWGSVRFESIETNLEGSVPDLPSDPSSMVELQKYDIFQSTSPTSNETTVGLAALAILKNPLSNSSLFNGRFKDLAWGNPFRLPVSLYLPSPSSSGELAEDGEKAEDEILLAKVITSPFTFASGKESTTISILGHLVSLAQSATSSDLISSSLSQFLANYLAGKDNTILLRYDSNPILDETETAPFPPLFVSTMLENLTIPLSFPGSESKLELFRNLRIDDMKIRLSSFLNPLHYLSSANENELEEPEGDLLCSGKVVGEIMLPQEFEGLMELIEVNGIWPDVYVYDGELPNSPPRFEFVTSTQQLPFSSTEDDSISVSTYPPLPIPVNAFARLRPTSLIPSTTLHIPSNLTHPAQTYLTATFIDAPLYLLPGRSEVFRKFVGKILFGGGGTKGVQASVRGVTGVKVEVGGFGQVGLEGLEIEGSFFVGKGGVGGI